MITIGLLPLYIKLYDDCVPQIRPTVEAFYADCATRLRAEGLRVETSRVCRVRPEFEEAVASFEKAGVQAIVTLHLAYSPSLESSSALAKTKLPIVVMNTTPDYLFDSPALINGNHGIHGVQDMCNLLIRNGKPFSIAAGYRIEADVARLVRAAVAANALGTMRVGLVGNPFASMGDFAIPPQKLKEDLGVEVIPYDLAQEISIARDRIDAEFACDKQYGADAIDRSAYDETVRAALAVRDFIDRERLGAFSMNFLSAGVPGFPTMPFAEACKAMARGIGYAGEGDALTAALVGALLRCTEQTSFCEMFCPDWAHNVVYLSHMGETNLATAENAHMIVKPFPYTPAPDPVAIIASMRPGKAHIVNLAPTRNGYRLIACPGEMLPRPKSGDSFANEVSGWFRPAMRILPDFLAEYSRAGGTHHSALVYDMDESMLVEFARQLNIGYTVIA